MRVIIAVVKSFQQAQTGRRQRRKWCCSRKRSSRRQTEVRSLVVMGDFDVVSISIFPAEADAPVLVDPDVQLAMPVAFKGFQAVGRGISGSSKNGSSAAHMAHCLPHPARPASRRHTTCARPGPGVNLPDKRSLLAGWPPTACCSPGSPSEIHALSPFRPFPAS